MSDFLVAKMIYGSSPTIVGGLGVDNSISRDMHALYPRRRKSRESTVRAGRAPLLFVPNV